MAKKTIIDIDAKKEGSEMILKLKMDKKIEEFIKSMSDTIEKSNSWKDSENEGLQFYKRNDKFDDFMENLRNSYDSSFRYTFDNFGSGLVDGSGRINLAMLRIVGSSDGIVFKVNNMVTYEGLKEYIERLSLVIKVIYQEFIIQQKVKAKITFEV